MTTENIDELRTRLNAANQSSWTDLTARFDWVLTELNHHTLTSSESVFYKYIRPLLSHLEKQENVKAGMNVYALTLTPIDPKYITPPTNDESQTSTVGWHSSPH